MPGTVGVGAGKAPGEQGATNVPTKANYYSPRPRSLECVEGEGDSSRGNDSFFKAKDDTVAWQAFDREI